MSLFLQRSYLLWSLSSLKPERFKMDILIGACVMLFGVLVGASIAFNSRKVK